MFNWLSQTIVQLICVYNMNTKHVNTLIMCHFPNNPSFSNSNPPTNSLPPPTTPFKKVYSQLINSTLEGAPEDVGLVGLCWRHFGLSLFELVHDTFARFLTPLGEHGFELLMVNVKGQSHVDDDFVLWWNLNLLKSVISLTGLEKRPRNLRRWLERHRSSL